MLMYYEYNIHILFNLLSSLQMYLWIYQHFDGCSVISYYIKIILFLILKKKYI